MSESHARPMPTPPTPEARVAAMSLVLSFPPRHERSAATLSDDGNSKRIIRTAGTWREGSR